ncbi:MAG TPA: PH domain-containing protein [Verrucomicrobiota bacterium]|nr:hypothetical protein [Verrucomicrobiales bacterium]HRI16537.1 PH domain-containing protein [Verrucomicrobiota bacterium]
MKPGFDEAAILAIERPDPRLWTYYVLCCLAAFPLAPILLPIHWFRYQTMRYRFTDQGVSMSWGILFRRQVLLNYARIQDIHLRSNVVERWLGLARLFVQTASGNTSAEMTIEGLTQFTEVRDFLYSRMRGVNDPQAGANHGGNGPVTAGGADVSGELTGVLREVAAELRALRQALPPPATPSAEQSHV